MKPIYKVFLVIGTLVLVFIVWALFFNDGGVLETSWNGLISPVNNVWQNLTGDSDAKILPTFGDPVDVDTDSVDSAGGGL